MYQTARGDNYFLGTLGPGSTVVSNAAATLKRVFWGGTYVGTLSIYDSATVAGTATSNQVFSMGLPLLKYPESVETDLRCKNGIVVVAAGTPTHTIVWGE